MGRKKKSQVAEFSLEEPTTDTSLEAASSDVASDSGPRLRETISSSNIKPRLSIPLKDDQVSIDWDSMRGENKERVRSVLGAPENSLSIDAPVVEFTPAQAASLYDLLGRVESTIAVTALKWDADVAKGLLYNDAQKSALGKPTADVLNKRSPRWLKDNADIMQLVMVLIAVEWSKWEGAAQEVSRRKAVKRTAISESSRHDVPLPTSKADLSDLDSSEFFRLGESQ